ncbi:MAG: Long-chain fatty-acid-CoA ligase [Parcubacteria group bacterium GW2011_GWE2_39_37]|nr:MAG: Long-chain fatty-acid-CoA ligase [Parcubacteria group bacterium GW2011_GWE2_39_37]
MESIYIKFKEVAVKHQSRPIVYWRKNRHWHHIHYKDLLLLVDYLAENLSAQGIKQGDRVSILSENRPEWLISDLAINKLGAVSVPIHTTANQPLIEYILNDSASGFLFVSEACLIKYESFLVLLKERKPDLKIALFDDSYVLKTDWQKNYPSIILYSSLIKKTSVDDPVVNELASIVYTSGTTGEPKGVMLSNKNFIHDALASTERIPVMPSDKFLSFLPLSHVLERTAGSYIPILSGASIAYAESIKNLPENLREVKPTIIISVPRIFEKMQEKIFAKIQLKGHWAKKLFFWSLRQKPGTPGKRIADILIYRKIRKLFGGHLRFAMSGGACINVKVLKFFKNVGVKIAEGYGLTETSPVSCTNSLENNKIGTVGPAINGVMVKIDSDKEILIKGENLMMGYWQKEDKTREAINEDGWLKTGDLGFLDYEGYLTVIGRKKDIIVTNNGKNIFPERIESLLNLSTAINQSLIVGHKKDSLSALIVPDLEAISQKYSGVKVDLQKLIEDEIVKVNEQLMAHEVIKKFHLLDRPFTIENEELTPTLKIRRHHIEAKYGGVIDGLYR